MGRKAVPEGVTASRFIDPGIAHCGFDRSLQKRLRDMMTTLPRRIGSIARIGRTLPGSKQILPAQFARSSRVLLCQRAGQIDFTVSCRQILFMDESSLLNLTP